MIDYKGAWYVLTPERVTALANAGFYFFLPIYQNDAQIDAVLAAVPAGCPVCVLTSGDDAEKARQITRLKNHNTVTGFLIDDETNLAGMSTAVQAARYAWCKSVAPFKAVFGSYHVEPTGLANPNNDSVVTAAGTAWDYLFVNFYPVTWGRTDTEAAEALTAACAATRQVFPVRCPIIPIEQAAGVVTETAGLCRPIGGLLQAQHDIWAAAGLVPLSAIVYYGDATNPETDNLTSNAELLAESVSVE